MKYTITILILMAAILPCNAQLLQPSEVKIELMDGTTKKAELYGYTDDAVIVKRIVNNNTNGKMDTLSFINIENITVFSNRYSGTFTLSGIGAGLIIGGIVGHRNEPAPTGKILDLTGLTTVFSSIIGGCIGASVGFLADISTRSESYIIYATEAKFKEFVKLYKSDG